MIRSAPNPRLLLIGGDLLALFLFIFIGREAHELGDAPDAAIALLLTAGEFWAAWLLAGWLAGAFVPGALAGPGGMPRFLIRSLLAWLAAAPLGVLLRAIVLGRAVIPTVFLGVALGVGGAFLLGWRLAFALIVPRLAKNR